MPDRTYRVLAEGPTGDGFGDLGVYLGHDAKAAIEAALLAKGLPDDVKVCAAVPTTNWSECDVAPDPRPQFKVTPRVSTKRRPTEGSTGGQVPVDPVA